MPQERAGPLRLFIALPIPEPVQAELRRFQCDLKRAVTGEGVKWVKPEQMHLTLKFLGKVESGRVEALIAATREACAGAVAFPLRADGADFFPDERRPRVLWAGLEDETGTLPSLQRAVEGALVTFAEKAEDRPFSPHLTLARIKSLRPDESRLLAEQVRRGGHRSFGEWTAAKVEVMQSELHPEGSRHTCLAEIVLGGP
jgi:RNA 2',3'-cyclic 3'-phosphodiesterase